jgi:hypothetical protein
MVAAIMIVMALMITAANPFPEFVSRHPTVKMLALSFLLLIGTCSSPTACTSTFRRATCTALSPSRSSSNLSTSGRGAGSFAAASSSSDIVSLLHFPRKAAT